VVAARLLEPKGWFSRTRSPLLCITKFEVLRSGILYT
jgi:hypothetical protein